MTAPGFTLLAGALLAAALPAQAQRVIPGPRRALGVPFDLAQLAGPPAPDGSRRLASSGLSGRIILLDFWDPACVPCGPMHEAFGQLAATYSDSGVTFISVSLTRDSAAVVAWLSQHGGATFPVVASDDAVVAGYEISSIPRVILLDSQYRIAWDRGGGHDPALILPRLLPYLFAERDGRPPPRSGNDL